VTIPRGCAVGKNAFVDCPKLRLTVRFGRVCLQ
jgi:hypothetical protein